MNFPTPHIPAMFLAIKILGPWIDPVMLAPVASQSTIAKESDVTSRLELQYFLASSSCMTLY